MIIFSRFNANIKEIIYILRPNLFTVQGARDDLKKASNLLISFGELLPISEANVDQFAEYARQSEQWCYEFREKYPVLASQASERTEDSVPHPSHETLSSDSEVLRRDTLRENLIYLIIPTYDILDIYLPSMLADAYSC